MKSKKKLFPLCFSIFMPVFLLLTACGQSWIEQEETQLVPTEKPVATEQPREPFTEAELRQAISELKEDEASLAQKQEYYERLLAMDVFAEEDYVELARLYGSRGDWEEQRRML